MLSFKPLCADGKREVLEYLFSLSAGEGEELICELISSFSELNCDGDCEVAVSFSSGCLLFRIFDMGRYIFAFPYEINENADCERAVMEIAEYAMREEIELVFTDVPHDSLNSFSRFRHMNIDAEGKGDALSFRIRIMREIDLIDDVPTVREGDISLTPLREGDIEDFARLSRDEDSLKYWGYDYREDNPDASDSWFYEIAKREFNTGSAITLAVRDGGNFVGECVLYGFFGDGSAEIAIRILPQYRGNGFGKSALRLGISFGEKIGLTSLRAYVFLENAHSVRMTESVMDKVTDDGIRAEFYYEI